MNDYDYKPLLIGTGMQELDISVGLLATIAAIIQYWRIACWSATLPIYAGRWLMAIGWTTLAGRVWQTLYQIGDILISLPSLISLIFIASGSIIVQLFWHPNVEKPR
jgi:hypothetical protein